MELSSIKIFKQQPRFRQEVIRKLVKALESQGMFSVLIFGERGTGKTFWLRQLLVEKNAVFIDAALDNIETIEKGFIKAHNGYCIIEDVEQLDHASQEWLFKTLSTEDGTYHIGGQKLNIRVVFTSSMTRKRLADEGPQRLISRFFDRISQLTIEFPSLGEQNGGLSQDIQHIWEQMKFPGEVGFPFLENQEIPKWLDNPSILSGNFRDIQKICIMLYHEIYECGNSEIIKAWKEIEERFRKHNRYPDQKTKEYGYFQFDPEEKWNIAHPRFKAEFKKWAKDQFTGKSIRQIEEHFSIGKKTMDNW